MALQLFLNEKPFSDLGSGFVCRNKFMKKFSLIFLSTLLLFFIINLAISFTWPIYSKFKSKKHQYIDEQVKILNLSEENLNILYDEMVRNYDKFAYVPFIGHTETKRVGKFL